MYSFINDYSEGAHERIVEALVRTNREQSCGYGLDLHCENARRLIQGELGRDSDIHFLVGGTQTNFTVISALLRPHQGVVSADTGHINVHESGAVEATGHKVLTIKAENGKITAAQVEKMLSDHYADENSEHTVQPGMVYISHPTELGTTYTKKELTALHDICAEYKIPLFLDGARLGCALAAEGADITLKDLAELTDIFYIGGTKMGAMFGEAVVINNKSLGKDFRCILKQHGGMMAKGRMLGIQFEELFNEGLYLKLAKHAVSMAQKIKKTMEEKGYKFAVNSPTNQIFPIMPKAKLEEIKDEFAVGFWEKYDEENDVVRICTSWAADEEMINRFLEKL